MIAFSTTVDDCFVVHRDLDGEELILAHPTETWDVCLYCDALIEEAAA